MFSADTINQFVHPCGFRSEVLSVDTNNDLNWLYEIRFTGRKSDRNVDTFDINISLPCVDKTYGRIISVQSASGTRTRIVCNKACHDATDSNDLLNRRLVVKSWVSGVIQALEKAICEAMMDFFFGGPPPLSETAQYKLNLWLSTAPHIMDVDPSNEIEVKDLCGNIVVNLVDEPMSHVSRLFRPEWLKCLDPCSTPQSDKINVSYRLADGAKIKDGIIQPGESIFCTTVMDNGIAMSLNPKRLHLMRTTFEGASQLVSPEEPRIKPRNHCISGVHLSTAIMHHGSHTFEDCIVISRSAAAKLNCYVNKRHTIQSLTPIKAMVNYGDIVSPHGILVMTEDEKIHRATKLHSSALVRDIRHYRPTIYNRKGWSCQFDLQSVYSMEDGDKISNRAAGKGVTIIADDADMPIDENGARIEVCVSPESIVGRMALLTQWEMMVHRMLNQNLILNIKSDPVKADPSFQELVNAGYGSKRQLYLRGVQLPELTFYGHVYWLRMDKFAKEQLSFTSDDRKVNEYGLWKDTARASGQKVELGKAIALSSRGLHNTLTRLMSDNVRGGERLGHLLDTLFGKEMTNA